MPEKPHNSWLKWFSIFTALTTLLLVCVGGLVTSHGAGMAVPDWPNTYGYNMFFFPISQWIGGIFYEHSHRLVASFVGLLTAILGIGFWTRETTGKIRWSGIAIFIFALTLLGVRKMPVYLTLAGIAPLVIIFGFCKLKAAPNSLRWLGVVAYAAVILQGVLGGLRVVWFADQIGIFHGTLAQLFFTLMCVIALLQTDFWKRLKSVELTRNGFRFAFLAATLLILTQLILGATMRHQHAGLAIPDFPAAYGKIWPDMDPDSVAAYNHARVEVKAYKPITAFQIGLQMVHRIVALCIFIAVASCLWLTKCRLGWQHPVTKVAFVWMLLILTQIFLGAATIWTDKSADVATTHVAVGALSLVTGTCLTIIAIRTVRATTQTPEEKTGLATLSV